VTEAWVSIDDIAAHLGVTKLSIYRWIEKRGLPATKVGKLWKLKLSEVDTWMRERPGPVRRVRTNAKAERVILLVDDDSLVRTSIAEFLRDEGYTVLSAADGAEALELLAGATRPDVILLDFMMPNVDGWQFREQQAKDPQLNDVPIIAITGAQFATLDGITAVLRKPLRLPVLGRTLEGVLEGA
jgi:excisionase family DNA binding protein